MINSVDDRLPGGDLANVGAERDVLAQAEALAHLGAWVWDITQDHIWWSDETYRIWGLSPQSFPVTFEAFIDHVHPDDRDALEAEVRAALAGDAEHDMVHRLLRSSGEIRYVHQKGRVDRAADGTPVRMLGTVRDITTEVELQQQRDQAVRALSEEAQRARSILEGMLDPWVLLEPVRDGWSRIVDFVYADANARACDYNRLSRDQLIGSSLLQLLPGHRGSQLFASYVRVVESGEPLILDAFPYPSEILNDARYYDIRGVRVDGGLSYTWCDVTDRVSAQKALAESEERYRMLSVSASEMVVLLRDHKVTWLSPSVAAFMGSEIGEILGLDLRERLESDDLTVYDDAYDAAVAGHSRVIRIRFNGPDCAQHWLEIHTGPYVATNGELLGVLTSSRVIDDLIDIEQELEHRARYDLLTGLMNRGEGLATATRLLGQHPRTGTLMALLFCDIDRFKEINDSHGHAAGDAVLRSVGDQLSQAIRSDDVAARIGGDEFLVMLQGVHSVDEAVEVAEKVLAAATERVEIGEVVIEPALSIGLTVAHPGDSTDTLLERADKAMYSAKAQGRNRVVAG